MTSARRFSVSHGHQAMSRLDEALDQTVRFLVPRLIARACRDTRLG
jgi:hypothetical protein